MMIYDGLHVVAGICEKMLQLCTKGLLMDKIAKLRALGFRGEEIERFIVMADTVSNGIALSLSQREKECAFRTKND